MRCKIGWSQTTWGRVAKVRAVYYGSAVPVPNDNAATEEAGSTPVGVDAAASQPKQQPRRFLDVARRDLSEEELASPAARRFLIAEIERLDDDCGELKPLRQELLTLKVENATLKEAGKKDTWKERLSFVASTIGAAGIGAAPSYIGTAATSQAGWIIAVGAALLVLVAVWSRLAK